MSNLPNAPEIEPLSEMSWRRIEQRVFDELDRTPQREIASSQAPAWWRTSSWRPVLAIGATAAAAAALLLMLRGADGESSGQLIKTQDSSVQITLERATLEVASWSELSVKSGGAEGVRVFLDRGSVDFNVIPSSDRPPFVVEAGEVRVEVVGTRFLVERGQGAIGVQVTQGTVYVFYEGKREALKAGQRWSIAAGAAEPTLERVRESRAAGEEDPAQEAEVVAPQESAQERYEKAAGLEASDAEAAAAMYRELAQGEGPWAANALFAHGRLELERGHRDAAVELLQDYLRRYPQGPNALDARGLLESASR